MGVKNKLVDLNNHLFEQLERLNDEDLKGEALEEEINRAKAITDISQNIISNADIALKAFKCANEYGYAYKAPDIFGLKSGDENE